MAYVFVFLLVLTFLFFALFALPFHDRSVI